MKQKIFTIYDSKAQAYLTPFFLHQEGMAIRIFTDCVNVSNHQFGKHPEDYTLFQIGSWDDEKSKFLTNNPVALATGIELVDPNKEKQQEMFTDPPVGDLKEVI